ncbi:MAG: 50S ribosomal protein L29 [Armatimonadetes bacterium]|nr:50S ribosomal protein L29 [Armatimonadota bacterium]
MKSLKANDLREKTVVELEELLETERASLFDFRRKLAFHEIKDVNSVKQQRHKVACILTVITEKKRGIR